MKQQIECLAKFETSGIKIELQEVVESGNPLISYRLVEYLKGLEIDGFQKVLDKEVGDNSFIEARKAFCMKVTNLFY